MKIIKLIVIVAVIAGLGYGVYNLWIERSHLEEKLNQARSEHEILEQEKRSLQAQITHFQNPENLKEEAKKNFNFKEPGEQMMIIVPDTPTGSSE